MNSAADGFADLSGSRSSGGWKVMCGLEKMTKATVNSEDGVHRVLSRHFLKGVVHCEYVLLRDSN